MRFGVAERRYSGATRCGRSPQAVFDGQTPTHRGPCVDIQEPRAGLSALALRARATERRAIQGSGTVEGRPSVPGAPARKVRLSRTAAFALCRSE